VYMPRLLAEIGFTESNSAARRVIAQGGVYLDGRTLDTEEIEIADIRGRVVAVGKRHFARMV
jgi:tyrosyl-tRNA synthetase